MELLDILRVVWFILVGVLLLGYSILGGFDLGVGTIYPFVAKNEKEKLKLMKAIGPYWDGNEVWLLTGGGALFASFPHVYATVFSGFYLAIMLVLFALIIRAVSIEFIHYLEEGKEFWFKGFAIGSFLPSLLFGVALGNIIVGVPLDQSMNFTGNFFTLLRPFPLLMGLVSLLAFIMQGSIYTTTKTDGPIKERAEKVKKLSRMVFLPVFALMLITGFLQLPEGIYSRPLLWVSIVISLTAWFRTSSGKAKSSFIMSSIMITGLWGCVGSMLFPVLVRANNGTELDMTIYNTSSSQLTLTVMLIIAAIGVPLVLYYTRYLFKTFRGIVK